MNNNYNPLDYSIPAPHLTILPKKGLNNYNFLIGMYVQVKLGEGDCLPKESPIKVGEYYEIVRIFPAISFIRECTLIGIKINKKKHLARLSEKGKSICSLLPKNSRWSLTSIPLSQRELDQRATAKTKLYLDYQNGER